MRSKLIVFFFLFLIIATISSFAQSVQVIEKVEVTSIDNGQFYYPKFSNTGNKIIFTTEAFKGLWIYDIDTEAARYLSQKDGVGFNPQFDRTDENILCRSYKFENMKRISSLLNINANNGLETNLLINERDLNHPMLTTQGNVFVLVNKNVVGFERSLQKRNPLPNESVVYIENSSLIVESEDGKIVLNPLGAGNYLWPSFSSDGQKILFAKAGEGTFITDLDGNIIAELERANYPRWSKNDEWIIYMDDYDDGVKFTSSDIKAKHIASGKSFDLTKTDDTIEMYPDYAASTDEVVYHTTDGRIIKLTLKFN